MHFTVVVGLLRLGSGWNIKAQQYWCVYSLLSSVTVSGVYVNVNTVSMTKMIAVCCLSDWREADAKGSPLISVALSHTPWG